MGTLEPEKTSLPKFKDYAKAWLENVEHELKPSTAGFYSQYLRLYVLPRFGEMELDAIKRDAAKSFITDLRHRNLAAPHLR